MLGGPPTAGPVVLVLICGTCLLLFQLLVDNAIIAGADESSGDNTGQSKLTCTNKSQYDGGLAFIHVTKAGGTSLRSYFRSLAEECGYKNHVEEAPFWKDMSDDERAAVQVYGGANHLGFFDLLSSWPGHFYPNPNAKAHWWQRKLRASRGDTGDMTNNVAYFTQLRNPWERARSDYFYAKGLGPIHHLHEQTKQFTVDEWIQNTQDGGMLSYFVPPADGETEQRSCCFDQTDLENAKQLLKNNFAVVGLVEDPGRTTAVLQCRVPWINQAIRRNSALSQLDHLNESPMQAESSASHATSVNEADIAKHFPLDWELYIFAKRLLNERHADCVKRGIIQDKK